MKTCNKSTNIFQEAIDHCRWKNVLHSVLKKINVFDYSIPNPLTRKSYGRHRRLRNKIIGNRLLDTLNKQGITNKGHETYTFVSEYYIKILEQSVLVEPYKNMTLGSGGMFNLRGDYLYKQLDRLDTLKLGYRKQHLQK